MELPSREELRKLSKEELIDIIYSMFDHFTKRIEALEAQIKPKKTSKNSSIAPATDLTSPNKNTMSNRKMGPSVGHAGKSRQICEHPDIIIKVPIEKCPRTGQKINSQSNAFKIHQIIDLTPPKLIVIEIQRQITTGPDGKTILAPNPPGVQAYQRFGGQLKAYIAYLRFRLNIPWKRILTFLVETANEKISAGTLKKIFHEIKTQLEEENKQTAERIRSEDAVAIDETGIRVNGKRHWLNVFRTQTETLYTASEKRNHQAAQSVLGKDYKGIVISDFYGAYNDTFFPQAKEFQKCLAHAIRDIVYAMETEKNNYGYAKKLMDVLLDGIYLKKYYIFGTPQYLEQRAEIENRFSDLLSVIPEKIPKEVRRLWKRFIKYRTDIFTFLYHENIPYDNNGSERDLRELVVCRKISGGYRTIEGLDGLLIVKGVIATAVKQGKNAMDIFTNASAEKAFQYC